MSMQHTEIFVKMKVFTGKRLIFFLIFRLNIDCVYTLETHRQDGSNEYTQSMFWSTNEKIPQFCCIQVGYKGVYITRTCFRDNT